MCVIIHKPKDIGFDKVDIETAYQNNKDGFGYMYYDPKKDRVVAKKSVEYTTKQLIKIFKTMEGKESCFHYRFRTVGEIVSSQCHPFQVLNKKKHGMDMYFMHNGTISAAEIKKDESDTMAFNRDVLKPLLSLNPKFIETKAFKDLIESYLGHSKLCFMYGRGKVIKFNEDKGAMRGECWVSNTGAFVARSRANANAYSGSNQRGNNGTGWQGQGNQGIHNRGTSNVTHLNKKMVSTPVNVHDEVIVYSHNDQEQVSEGRITKITHSKASVSFTKEKVTVNVDFWLEDGNSEEIGGNLYYAYPKKMFDNVDFEERTTVSQKKVKNPATINTQKLLQEIASTVTKTGGVAKPALKSIADIKKAIIETKDLHTYKNITFDTNIRWGGAWITDPFIEYGDFNLYELYAKSPEERMEYFIDNQNDAFSIFQDLVEWCVLNDEEFFNDGSYETMIPCSRKEIT